MQVNASVADWFVKADDDTFLIYPNLLELLAPLDSSEPLYLGLPLIYRPEVGSIARRLREIIGLKIGMRQRRKKLNKTSRKQSAYSKKFHIV